MKPERKWPRGGVILLRAALLLILGTASGLIIGTLGRTADTNRLDARLQASHTAYYATLPPPQAGGQPEGTGPAEAGAGGGASAGQEGFSLPEGMAQMGYAGGETAVHAAGTAGKAEAAETRQAVPGGESDETVASAVYHRTGTDILPEMRELYRENPDLVGWIQIEGLLDLPVVYRDNEYYLNHDFDGRRSSAGTLFLDAGHPLTETAANLLIHGHNMKDGTMFGCLSHYLRDNYLRKHSIIRFSTLWDTELYEIFAVLRVSTDPEDPHFVDFNAHPVFSSDKTFRSYISTLRRQASQRADASVEPGNALLTLATCLGEDRLVLVARKLN